MRKLAPVLTSVVVAIAALIPAGAAHAVISGTGGQVTKIAPPPSVDRLTGLDSDTTQWAWDEQQGVTLATPVRIDINAPGDYESSTSLLTGGTIPAGTVVDSHFWDSVPVATHAGVTLTGTLTFPSDILGVIVTRGKLLSSNILGSPGTDYTTASVNNAPTLDPAQDGVILPDLRTVTFRTNRASGADVDQIRIITKHDSSPAVNAGGPYSGVEGSAVTLHGTATDPESDPLQISWSFSWTGSPGTVCTPTNTTTLTPSIICNDDAVVTASLQAQDPYNPPAVSSAQVTISNVAPTLAPLTVPTALVPLSTPVGVSATFADVGTNDTHSATIDWGDTTSSPATITETNGAGSLTGSHTYALRGHYTITVTLTDDNGGLVVSTAAVDVDGPPTADAGGPYTGSEGSASGLVGTAVDPENDPLATTWSFTPTSQDAGTTCTSTGTSTLTPTITCNDDAVVSAQLSASDGINPPTLSATTVTVNNVAPVLGSVTTSAGPIAVGAPVNVSAPFSDVGTNDTHTATVNWGDLTTSNATITESNGSGTLAASHAYATAGVYSITITLLDDNGGSATATSEVLVNTPPTVDTGGPYVGLEGAQMALHATAHDVDGDALSYAWTFTWTGDPGTQCIASGANTLTPDLICNDNATVTATLSVSDGVNAAVVGTTTILVGNVAPVVGAAVASAPLVPTLATFSVSAPFSDAGTNDTHTTTIDWGDNTSSPGSVTEVGGAGTATGSHSYTTSGTYTVTVTVTDDNGDSSFTTTQVVVNDPPTASAGGPYSGAEGTAVPLLGTAHDVDGDPLTTTWAITWAGDAGTGCVLSAPSSLTPTVTCNDNATVNATLTVSDGINTPVVDTTQVTIANAAPSVGSVTLPTGQQPIATPVSLSATFSDAGTNDTHTATIDWGDSTTSIGTVTESAGAGSVTGSHLYATSGTFPVTVTVTDDNGGQGTSSGSVLINGAPTAGAGGPYSGNEGSAVALNGTATDPESSSLSVSWTDSVVSSDPGTTCSFTNTSTLTPTISCTDDATVDATIQVSDGVNPTVVDTATVTMHNAPPVVAAPTVPGLVATGATVSLNTSFTDPGSNDTHTATIDWGDSTSSAGTVVESGGNGTVAGSHVYGSSGTYHVTVTVTDDNGGSSTATADVIVNGAPTVNAGGPYAGIEGSSVTLGANATDPEGDPLTVSWTKSILSAGPGTVCTFTGVSTLAPVIGCNDDAVVSVTVTVSDGVNPAVHDTTTVTIVNAVPTVATPNLAPNPTTVGSPVLLSTSFSDPGTNDTHLATVDWGDSTTSAGTVTETLGSGSGTVTGGHTYAASGTYTVTVTVNDKDGGIGSSTAQIVIGAPPTADAGGPYAGLEGSPVTLHGALTNPGGGPLGTSWSITWLGSPGTACTLTGSTTLTPSVTCNDNATVTATLSVTDGVNPAATSSAQVNIANVAPVIGSITVPSTPVPVNTALPLQASFTDAGTNDTHTATIAWGDASTSAGTVTEASGTGTVSASHPFTAAGTYTVSVTVRDDDNGTTTAFATTYVVVYDPSAGFVTGGGYISSPSGAYTPANPNDADYTGKANFGFVSKYLANSTAPSGNTEFDLHSASLDFHATGMAWLVVTNTDTKAYYSGTGSVNGASGYSFLVSVIDGGKTTADTFRIKVWNTSTGTVVYDNQAGGADSDSATQAISNGSIVIHG